MGNPSALVFYGAQVLDCYDEEKIEAMREALPEGWRVAYGDMVYCGDTSVCVVLGESESHAYECYAKRLPSEFPIREGEATKAVEALAAIGVSVDLKAFAWHFMAQQW